MIWLWFMSDGIDNRSTGHWSPSNDISTPGIAIITSTWTISSKEQIAKFLSAKHVDKEIGWRVNTCEKVSQTDGVFDKGVAFAYQLATNIDLWTQSFVNVSYDLDRLTGDKEKWNGYQSDGQMDFLSLRHVVGYRLRGRIGAVGGGSDGDAFRSVSYDVIYVGTGQMVVVGWSWRAANCVKSAFL